MKIEITHGQVQSQLKLTLLEKCPNLLAIIYGTYAPNLADWCYKNFPLFTATDQSGFVQIRYGLNVQTILQSVYNQIVVNYAQ